ncbi:MAG: MG2 domain-containing protein, partial [Prevotella sp.]|nr:MG2 domain-containing protein [Prevotella sp.]
YVKTSKNDKEAVYTTDSKGECVLGKGSFNCYVSATKDDDKALLSASIYNNFNSIYRNNGSVTSHTIFTDRGIYRPGQTVHVSLLAYDVTKGVETAVEAGQNVKVSLYDANYNNIGEATVMTNEYGVAATEFTLPEKTLSGLFHIRTASGSESFRVEEYVRPTFEVSIPRPKVNYRQGDTITVKGTAKAYSGAPLGNARVVYNVKRQQSWWWRRTGEGNKPLLSDTVTTDMQGNFEIRMPMLMPEDNASDEAKQAGRWWICPPRFYDIVAEATVTDIAGESHSASLSLPISNRESILTSNLKEMMLRDSVNTVIFTRRNQAGTEIEGIVSVAVDGRKISDVEVGKAFTLPRNLASGVHSLLAICEKDTIKQSFVIFSMDDKRPVISTPDWYYLSSDRFSSEKGKPVYVQFGSSKRDSYAYYALFSGDKVLESGAVKIDSSLVTRQFEYKAEYGDGVCLSLAWVRDGVLYEHSATITKPLADKSLSMKWTTFRNRLQPGQRETWTLSVTDSEGKPADANVMATLYDKSLEAITPFSWHFSDPRHIYVASQSWQTAKSFPDNFHGYATFKRRDYTSLAFDVFVRKYLSFGCFFCIEEVSRPLMRSSAKLSAGVNNMGMVLMAKKEMAAPMIERHSEVVAEDVAEASEEQIGKDVALREKLGETAFFLSDVRTDADGVATLSFTLPESVTTWRFLAFANDKNMRFGMMKDEVVAQKQLMIQPRMPRFLREGDKCSVPASIANLTEKVLDVKVRLTLLDAETGESVAIYNNKVEVKPGESSAVNFDIDSNGLDGKMLVAKWIADAGTFSDGEQHYLPVLSAKELMLDTRTFVLQSPGEKEVDIKSMLPLNAEKARLSLEYTDAPEWLLIQSLPQIADASDDNAISLVASYYANTLASHIAKSNPDIAETVREWTQDYSSLESPLDKNEELRHTILAETPWMVDADSETAQRKMLYRLFDASLLASRQAFALQHLKALQLADGGFSWWKGMESSRYMTVAVTQTLLRLQAMVGEGNAYDGIITNAFRYLDKEIAKDVKYMKEAKRKKNEPWLSSFDLDYLYCRAIYNGKMSASVKADIDFMMAYIVKNTRYLDMQSKAGAAIILSRFGNKKAADEYLQSIIEHTVYKEDMGRYFDSYRAAYSWADYRIPTQTSVIEAIKALRPEQRQTISEMQRWLLQSKRTQAWDTPVNAINAIYAFFGPDFALRHGMQAEISLGTKILEPDTYASALRYEKVSVPLDEYSAFSPLSSAVAPKLKIDKKSDGESWANVYLQYVVPASDAKDAANGISIRRELSSKALKVGDKVTVTITITADRDYDFVTVTDHRPACLEPVKQLSEYRNGCYQVMRDSQSQYHFSKMAKGKHVITTEYYVSRAGDFTAGTATVQCAYAPEFAGRTAGKTISSRK